MVIQIENDVSDSRKKRHNLKKNLIYLLVYSLMARKIINITVVVIKIMMTVILVPGLTLLNSGMATMLK